MLDYVILIIWTSITYCLIAVGFLLIKDLPNLYFTIIHYILIVVVFIVAYYLYFRFIWKFDPFKTMIVSILSIFIIEYVLFNYFYKWELWFLNFKDWIVPVFIGMSTIYFVWKYSLD